MWRNLFKWFRKQYDIIHTSLKLKSLHARWSRAKSSCLWNTCCRQEIFLIWCFGNMMGTLKPTVHQAWNILTFNIKCLPSVLLFFAKFRKDQYPNNAMNLLQESITFWAKDVKLRLISSRIFYKVWNPKLNRTIINLFLAINM